MTRSFSSSTVNPKRRRAKGTEVSSSSEPSQTSNRSSPVDTAGQQLFWRQRLALCLGLIVVVFACYTRVVRNGFIIYDDNEYITDNPHVKEGLSWATVKWAFTSYDASNWHPLTWLSHALDVSVFGLNPVGPHLENVLLHAINAVLLFLFLQYATGFRWRSLMVAALFALHPVNVESVAWAAERKNVLSMLFFLLTLYAYVWYTRGPTRRRFSAVLGLFVLALLAKPQVITLPFVLLLLDYWPLARFGLSSQASVVNPASIALEGSTSSNPRANTPQSLSFLLREKWALFLLCVVSAVITMLAQKTGGAVKDFSRYSPVLRVETALISYVRYLGMAVWPTKLVAMYPHPTRLYPAWQVGAAALLLIAITAAVFRERAKPYLAVGWLWFLGTLVPMIGLVQVGVQARADRYAYISFIGLFVMMVWLAGDWVQAYGKGGKTSSPQGLKPASRSGLDGTTEVMPFPRPWMRWLLPMPAILCLLVLGVLTYRQVGYWHDTESFWRRTLALTQDNYVAHKGLGSFLYSEHKTQEALEHVREVVSIRPDEPVANMILGDDERSHGNFDAAIVHYRVMALNGRYAPLRAKAYADIGNTYRQMKQPAQAKQSFEASLALVSNQPAVIMQLGLIAQLYENDPASAVHLYARAMQLQPTDVGLLLLGNALLEEGHDQEGNAALEHADRISKNIDEARKQAEALVDGN
ncbi:MAG: hypothetical protein ACLQLC_15285 [Candidatus Sulfotelmatobacter sp.]